MDPKIEKEEQYSTLEYHEQVKRQTLFNEKQCLEQEEEVPAVPVVPMAASISEKAKAQLGMGIDPDQRHSLSRIITNPPPAYILVDSDGKQQPLYTTIDSASGNSIHHPFGFTPLPERRPAENKIMGLRRSTFIAVAAGLGLFIVGIVLTGVVLAVTMAKAGDKSSAASGTGTASNPSSADTLGGKTGTTMTSKLAALNWTDFASPPVDHSCVFYQDMASNALMASMSDSLSNQLRTVNISSLVSGNLDILPGTPLAAATNRGLWNLYYITSLNQVSELYSTDPFSNWAVGEFYSKLSPQAIPGSRLAAVQQICTDCANALLVLYQDESGSVQMSNFTNGMWAKGPAVTQVASIGTGLGISTFMDYRGKLGTNLNSLRMYYEDGANLMEGMLGIETKFRMGTGNNKVPITSVLSASPSPEIASLVYGAHGWDNNLVTTLSPEGDLLCSGWTGMNWTVQAPTIVNNPQDIGVLTSIAASQDMKMWAWSDGVIHRYRVSDIDAFSWVWETSVNTVDGTKAA